MDITDVILSDHHEQRRIFAYLDDVDRTDTEALSAIWGRLEVLLEVHAAAEEALFYPELLKIGTGGGSADGTEDEVTDAVKDHNEIRDAVRKVRDHEVGSDAWWQAVVEAREANSDHMAEEEREDLADFRHHADLATRHEIAVRFVTFESRHAAGTDKDDVDPKAFVQQNS